MTDYFILEWTWGSWSLCIAANLLAVIAWTVCLTKICKIQHNEFFIKIGILLLISPVSMICWSSFSFKMTQLYYKNEQQYTEQVVIYNFIWWFFTIPYWVPYCIAHWMFAFRYWTLSYRMKYGEDNKNFIWIYYVGLSLNLAAVLYTAISGCFVLPTFVYSFVSLVLIQLVSCVVLFDACYRMFVYIKTKENTINNRAVVLHVSVYLVFLIAIIYYFFSSILHLKDDTRKHWFISNGIF